MAQRPSSGVRPSVNFSHFELLLKNDWRNLHKSWHKCSLRGLDQELLLFKSIQNPIWPPWPLIGWHILNFSRTTEGIYSILATNVPYKVPTKSYYFLNRSEIQYGRPGLWLADAFWIFPQERLKGPTSNLPPMFFMRSRPSVFTLQVDLTSNMATLASVWLIYF